LFDTDTLEVTTYFIKLCQFGYNGRKRRSCERYITETWTREDCWRW